MELPAGFRASLPLGLPTAVVGVSFGLVAEPAIGGWPALVMSALVWSGTAQFAALTVLTGGGGPLSAGSTALLSNARFLPMGFAIAPSVTGNLLRRFFTGALLADASFAIAHRRGGRFDPLAIAWAAPVQYVAWVGGTAAGVAGADALSDPNRWGLDVLFPVFYLSLLLPELFPDREPGDASERSSRSHDTARRGPAESRRIAPRAVMAASVAAVITLALTPIAPPGIPVLAAGAAALIGLAPTRDPGVHMGRGGAA